MSQQQMEEAVNKLPERPGEIVIAGFQNQSGFELMLKQAKWLSQSSLVPKEFQGNMSNIVIALEMANRMGASPLAVMQNIYLVHGKPGWSAQFITAAINSTGKFSPLRFKILGDGDGRTCLAWATEKDTGERLEGPPVSIEMAKKEGWYNKNGSKWQTMPELMLRYRAATFFGRLYAPEVLMGMKTIDEISDSHDDDAAVNEEISANAGTELIDVEFNETTPKNGDAKQAEKQNAGNGGGADRVTKQAPVDQQNETPADPPW